MTGPNVRLQEPLKSLAAARARSIGLSLNAYVAFAVRTDLERSAAIVELPQVPSAASAAGATKTASRSALPSSYRSGQKSAGVIDEIRFTCPGRFKPRGIVGADFYAEWRRHVEARGRDPTWYRDHDPRRFDLNR